MIDIKPEISLWLSSGQSRELSLFRMIPQNMRRKITVNVGEVVLSYAKVHFIYRTEVNTDKTVKTMWLGLRYKKNVPGNISNINKDF